MNFAIRFFVFLALISGASLAWLAVSFIQNPAGTDKQKVRFEVEPGSSFSKVAQHLEQKKLITDSFKFKIYAKFKGDLTNIRVGEYELSPVMTPGKILQIISSGKSIQRTFTIPEGENIYEIASILERKGLANKQELLDLFRNPKLVSRLLGEELSSLEGYLFPETYSYTKYTTPRQIVEMMVRRFLQVWSEVPFQESSLSRHQVVTLASVVEKETGAPEERPVIASVFHNRLRKKMRLQSDPTILYGILFQTGSMKKNIQKKDILAKTPYNTYAIPALPAGPIANPGREALEAVLRPGKTDFLYFVSRNDGTHVFSKTYKQHNKAVREYQLNRKARKGKSWRDLQKRKSNKRSDI